MGLREVEKSRSFANDNVRGARQMRTGVADLLSAVPREKRECVGGAGEDCRDGAWKASRPLQTGCLAGTSSPQNGSEPHSAR